MQDLLKPRMRMALERLREECDYEDSRVGDDENYILGNKLAPGIGKKTILELKKLGMIETGMNRWFNREGYRITDTGREALK